MIVQNQTTISHMPSIKSVKSLKLNNRYFRHIKSTHSINKIINTLKHSIYITSVSIIL